MKGLGVACLLGALVARLPAQGHAIPDTLAVRYAVTLAKQDSQPIPSDSLQHLARLAGFRVFGTREARVFALESFKVQWGRDSTHDVAMDTVVAWEHRGWIKYWNNDLVGHQTDEPGLLFYADMATSHNVFDAALAQMLGPCRGSPMPSWGRDSTQAQLAWLGGFCGAGVTMGVIDSGILPSERSDYAHLQEINTSYDGGPNDAADLSGDVCRGHGRWTASAMASGAYGVAPDASLIVAKGAYNVGGSCGMYGSSMWQAFQQLVAMGATIVNVSYDMSNTPAMSALLAEYRSRGVVLFASAGNSNGWTPVYPASDTNAVAVMAVDQNGNLAGFSNRGGTLSAPGVNVMAYAGEKNGTSMASPYAAAADALVLSACHGLSHDAQIAFLTANVDNPDPTTHGRVNAAKAIAACHGAFFAGPTTRTYTATTRDSIRFVGSGTLAPNHSAAVLRNGWLVFTASASDTVRVIVP